MMQVYNASLRANARLMHVSTTVDAQCAEVLQHLVWQWLAEVDPVRYKKNKCLDIYYEKKKIYKNLPPLQCFFFFFLQEELRASE